MQKTRINAGNISYHFKNIRFILGIISIILGCTMLTNRNYIVSILKITDKQVEYKQKDNTLRDEKLVLYHFKYIHQIELWKIESDDDRNDFVFFPITLPDFKPTNGKLTFNEVQDVLKKYMKNKSDHYSKIELNFLKELTLSGKRLFNDSCILNSKKVDNITFNTKQKLLKEKKIPEHFLFDSPDFYKNLQDWHISILPNFKKIEDQNKKNYLPYDPDGTDNFLVLQLSPRAIKRVLSKDFGKKEVDRIIYLQYLCAFNQKKMFIDGYIGKQTKKCLYDILTQKYELPEAIVKKYIKSLK